MNVGQLRKALEELRSMLPMSEKEFGKVFLSKTGCVWSEIVGDREATERCVDIEATTICVYRNYPIVIMCEDGYYELRLDYYILMLGNNDGYVIHFDFDKINAVEDKHRNGGEE